MVSGLSTPEMTAGLPLFGEQARQQRGAREELARDMLNLLDALEIRIGGCGASHIDTLYCSTIYLTQHKP